MKIVIAAGVFYPDVGGPAIHARKIAEEIINNSWQTEVIAYGNYKAKNEFPFKIKRVSRRYLGLIRWLLYFWKVFWASIGADVIYAFDPTAAGLPAFLAAKILGKKFIIRIGGDPIWERVVEKGKRFLSLTEYYDQKLYFKDKPFLFKAMRWMLKRADAIVVYSEFFKKFYRDYYGVVPEKIKIILNPVSRIETTEGLKGEPIFLFAGRFVAYKNLDLVIRVFSKIRQKLQKGKLILIGHGPEREALELQIANCKLQHSVEIKPQMDQEKLFQEIRRASVCIAPALTEFNPNFILESLSLGKPALVSRGNGLSVELPEDFLFDPKNERELEKKLSQFFDPNFYKKAINLVEKLPMKQSWDSVLASHLEVIKSLNH